MLCLQYSPSFDWSCQCQGHYFIQSNHRMLKIKWEQPTSGPNHHRNTDFDWLKSK